MKRVWYVVILLSFFVLVSNVSAKSIYYINDKGVAFTKEEYDFLSYMFWDKSQDLMSQDDYERFVASDIMHGELGKESITIDDGIMPLDTTEVRDQYATLQISKSCTSTCLIAVAMLWNGIPTIPGYDVIGAILDGTSLANTPSATVNYSNVTTSYASNMQKFTKGTNGSNYNGFGVSVYLPTSGSNLNIASTFRTKLGGHVYASYQHASEKISLADSKKYTLSRVGYGGVFNFTGKAYDVYDRMNGVNITL